MKRQLIYLLIVSVILILIYLLLQIAFPKIGLRSAEIEREVVLVGDNDETTALELVDADESLEMKSLELQGLLEDKEYIRAAIVSIQHSDKTNSNYICSVILSGDDLDLYEDEIVEVVFDSVNILEPENLTILDHNGITIFP